MNRLAEQIRAARLEAKLTEKQLAKKVGLTENFIVQVESNRKILNESIAEKILTVLGKSLESIEPELKEEPYEPKSVVQKAKVKEETLAIQPNAQWQDALSGIIRSYPILKGQKVVGHQELVISSKKIEGVHPDYIQLVESQESCESFRVQKGDLLYLAVGEQFINDRIYLIDFYNKHMVRKVRKESDGNYTVSPGLSGGSPERAQSTQVKVIGRLLRVSFSV